MTRLRCRKVDGKWQTPHQEIVYLVTSLTACQATPKARLQINREHWGIEIMRCNKGVILGEDGYASRLDNAPGNVISLIGLTLKILKTISRSAPRGITVTRPSFS